MIRKYPSTLIYRAAIAFCAAAIYVPLIGHEAGIISPAEPGKAFQLANNDGAILTSNGLLFWFWLSHALTVSGLAGVFFFWKLGRELLVFQIIATVLCSPFQGLLVATATEATLGDISVRLLVCLTCASYWSSISARFEAGHLEERNPIQMPQTIQQEEPAKG